MLPSEVFHSTQAQVSLSAELSDFVAFYPNNPARMLTLE